MHQKLRLVFWPFRSRYKQCAHFPVHKFTNSIILTLIDLITFHLVHTVTVHNFTYICFRRNVLVKIPIRSIFGWIGCAVYQAIHYWPPKIFYIIIFLKSIPLPVFSANFIAIPDVMWVFLNPIFFWNFTDSLN